jgi:hypothetical protein
MKSQQEQTATQSPAPRQWWSTPWMVALLGLAWIIATTWLMIYRGERLGSDYFPLDLVAQRVARGQTVYGPEATREIGQEWLSWSREAGIAYPLPYLMLLVPLTLLPYTLAMALWIGGGTVLAYRVVQLDVSRSKFVLPLLYGPFMVSVLIGQTTLIWFGLIVALILGVQRRKVALVSLLIPLLALKPQTGIFYSAYGLWWLWKQDRRGFFAALALGLALLGFSLFLEPTWIQACLKQLAEYNRVVGPIQLLPLGLVILAAAWKSPWWVVLAALQVVLFPLSDYYATLPLLLFWASVGGRPAMIGAAASWIWFVPTPPRTEGLLWVSVLLPVAIYALLEWYRRRTALPAPREQP